MKENWKKELTMLKNDFYNTHGEEHQLNFKRMEKIELVLQKLLIKYSECEDSTIKMSFFDGLLHELKRDDK